MGMLTVDELVFRKGIVMKEKQKEKNSLHV